MSRLQNTALSVLDLAPVRVDGTVAEALQHSLQLAQLAEKLGFKRFWVAEHHNMDGIASAATAVLIGYLAAGTQSIRLGAGGVMLPNHSPLVIAEQFGTLESLYPGRIDLGLGRAPGTDPFTAYALRRERLGSSDDFPVEVEELQAYFAPRREGQQVIAVPGHGTGVPLWILGSSLFGARLAAAKGLPFAFASHFAPRLLFEAIDTYRRGFQPSPVLSKPYLMIAAPLLVADSDEQAEHLATSAYQRVLALVREQSLRIRAPLASLDKLDWQPWERQAVFEHLGLALIGGAEKVEAQLEALLERTQADELIVTCDFYALADRLRALQILADLKNQDA
ncbi:hypothetical protein AXE65_01495 [Ventosimonas gracilis]|uniref:Luciferase-like monooxygenase n=1 Tax=Ventosimonas gracilis TaxID=1680762 RepID=A0A139SV03_9GAMM|nr:LLM class flavin-dependent oxidoreductase [Ventosimonas gracilis]KXU38415.1 hypothetical protein AXE65_01495 [Ventosimonas gracilis]